MNLISLCCCCCAAALVASVAGVSMAASAPTLSAAELKCEYKTNPLGLDVAKPRLSWVLRSSDSDARGQAQSAYQILVASSADSLAADKGDLWDTGKVASDETIQIPYAGKPLASNQRAFWKVKVWNGPGDAGRWSEPAFFSAGLLQPTDWKAKWIGYDEPAPPDDAEAGDATSEKKVTLKGLHWIWTDEGDASKDVPAGNRYFAKQVSIPGKVTKAQLIVACDDSFKLTINGKPAGSGGTFKQAQVVDVANFLKTGENLLAIEGHNGKGPAGLVGRFVIWTDGAAEPLVVNIDGSWKFAIQKPAGWDEGRVDLAAMKGAKESVALGEQPWGNPEQRELILPPPPYLRKTFNLDKPVARATAYATARGLYELHLNGQRVGNYELTPGWTDYKKRIYYQTYDVTPIVKQGANAVGAILGDGWHSGYFSYQGKRNLYGSDPSLLVQLEIEFADGTRQTVVSDETWKAGYGPIREGDLLMGSAYDARKEIPGWDTPAFDDASWKAPSVAEPPKALIQPHPGLLPARHEEIAAKKISEPAPGTYVFDLGQNMVGWVRLKVKGQKPGTRITLRHSEMLNPDGTPYLIALRGARAMDTYVAKGGDGEETWEPKFTFHGFRYVEVKGLEGKPSLDAITGVVVHTAIPRTGEFACSDDRVNQLFHNIIWGQKGNYLEVPTDCPQRDERLGWTGDAQFFIPTGAYNFDVAAFFTKWLVDLDTDAQHPDGGFADVAPNLLGGHGNVAWGDAGVICPYVIYKVYGDTRIIERHYAEMAKYIDYLKSTAKDFVRGQGAYGDWLNLDDKTKPEVIGTAYFQYVTRLMGEMAAVIGKTDDAAAYKKLADDVRAAFQKNFVNDDGSIKESGQTGYALAFTMNLIPDDKRDAAAEHFAKAIARKNDHLATGFIGTPRLLPGLTKAQRTDLAYKLFLTDTFPSWLFQVKLGATTMWERWDGWTPDKGFQDPGMNSFNHYAFGSVGEWMYRTVSGIDTDGPGYKKIALKPQPGEGLRFARAKYDSVRGEIASEWKREGDAITYTFVVPPNTSATVTVPAKSAEAVTESGKPAGSAPGVKLLRSGSGEVVYEVGSGRYAFSVSR
jgi:alpha-L-rhamnosidase